MLKFNKLENIQIFGDFEGQRVQITKIDLYNQTCNVVMIFMGKKVRVAYNSQDEIGKKLIISNFSNIEIVEGTPQTKNKLIK